MSTVRQLSKEDVLFVAGETDTVYQHTAGLVILDASAAPNFNFETFRERSIARIRQIPHFRWKLHEVPLGLDLPYWVEDENFSYSHHFKRIAVPSPGDREALAEVVAYLYSKHLDRSRPLWEIWFIEGLAGGKFAILQKLHHCMMDGQGASKLGEILCDLEPVAEPRPVDDAITKARPGLVPGQWQQSASTALHLARLPGDASRGIYSFIRPKLLKKLGWEKNTRPEKPGVPSTSFNAEIGSERGFVFGSLALTEIKAVKQAFGVSVNDVVLTLVGSSMRNYLLAHSDLPDAPLRTSIAVSLRTGDDAEFSNKVTTTSLTLATDIEDPVARLRAINGESVQAKQQARKGGMGMLELMQLMPPVLINAMVNATPSELAPQMMGANLIVSNVRASSAPMYIAGVRMETMYPMSIITPGLGINFTCVSYADHVDFGVTIEPELVPQPWDIINGLGAALQEYLALAGEVTGQKKSKVKQKTTRSGR
ncbi:MAG: wax ester/triacylglycerol synthase family O-acyltransferase [Halioglobus sp.]